MIVDKLANVRTFSLANDVQFPEKYFRGFDVYGASHQTFHIIIAIASFVFWGGLTDTIKSVRGGQSRYRLIKSNKFITFDWYSSKLKLCTPVRCTFSFGWTVVCCLESNSSHDISLFLVNQSSSEYLVCSNLIVSSCAWATCKRPIFPHLQLLFSCV